MQPHQTVQYDDERSTPGRRSYCEFCGQRTDVPELSESHEIALELVKRLFEFSDNPRHLHVIILRYRGLRIEDIAKKTGYHKRYIYDILSRWPVRIADSREHAREGY